MSPSIWWIRRDLRLHDNQALAAALERGDGVVPLFILDDVLATSPYVGPKRLAFLYGCLKRLDEDLRRRGSRLILRRGRPVDVLRQVSQECDAGALVAEADYSPYARRRDKRVSAALPLQLVDGVAIRPVGLVEKKAGGPYTVFTPFSRAWHELPPVARNDLLPAPEALTTPELATEVIPDEPRLPDTVPFAPGAEAAHQQLDLFLAAGIAEYRQLRDRVDLAATSRLSPYLRFGLLSARQCAVAALEARNGTADQAGRQGADTWLNELIWRDFYLNILYHFPEVRRRSFRAELDHILWRNDEDEFAAWRRGETGYPLVDAAMRQLMTTGWMHNRARMIVASFLVKDLLIDWRWGERWFMQQLIDGDPASNNGGWQWSAGTGTDAAPYFRIFNPTTQARKFDPHGHYIRHWVPELARVPDSHIHEPAGMPDALQEEAGCRLGRDYPRPIVDHRRARERTLEAYRQAREAGS